MKHFSFLWAALFMLLCCPIVTNAQKNKDLGKTPAMGWNSWNKFTHNINEDLIKQIADAMVSSGLKDAGYVYVNLDDYWHGERDANGFIQADPKKFPSGIKALSDYVHGKGLKFGIYTDCGVRTCAGLPGSFGHEYQDALQYARWGVDYLKCDWCNTQDINPIGAYRLMRDALYATGRPIYFSICEWGSNKPWKWAPEIGQSWRTTGDITNNFNSVLYILEREADLRQYAGPGHWNDPDMLEVGNGMSINEDRAHFTMWCMLAAPLILGNDVRNIKPETLDILTNKEVIALDQDKLGIQALKFATNDSLDFWFKPLENGDWAFSILNLGKTPHKYIINWKNFNVNDDLSKRSINFDSGVYDIRNLWSKKQEGNTKKSKTVTIPAHDVLVYRLSLKNK
ncbi:MAG: glycoside hydrolase family 27 protein [Bacteroidaceae bacterium]